ncbi:MAG: alpha-glucan family phosphorylase, partial [Lentisphaerae bacterium]
GILAGEHIKTASDLGIPMVGVGLLYRHGYFRQYLNHEGIQQEITPENDWYSMPVSLENDEYGMPLKGFVEVGDEMLWFQIWSAKVGRCKIYLLDANIPDNPEHLRKVTAMLYDQDRKRRLLQEMLLGIGGMRALDLLGFNIKSYHINEGHSAFLLIERLHMLMQQHQLSFDEAKEYIFATTVFTTHTPVPAGNERFPPHLMEICMRRYIENIGFDWDRFMALGRENPYDSEEHFCMTVLALRLCAFSNGVSRLHGEVSRRMWRNIYDNIPIPEIPIQHVTNGIHARSWLNPHMNTLLGEGDQPVDPNTFFNKIDTVDDGKLWEFRCRSRAKLVEYVREQLKWQYQRRNTRSRDLSRLSDVLDPNALTIGFARRMTTYKRAYLFMHNPQRLAKILNDPDRPVQIIIAGKAHPADLEAKEIIREIFELCQSEQFYHRIVFLEDYDIAMARHLVQGVDLWLNTPRRPMEASGTSGMKVSINGGLHCSVLDGWWDEAYSPDYGWAIGQREEYDDPEVQDHIEADILYSLLEKDIVPTFYDRDEDGIPREWVTMMKRAVKTLGPQFSSERMLRDYVAKFYMSAFNNMESFAAENFQQARNIASWRKKIRRAWSHVRILEVSFPEQEVHYKGHSFEVTAKIDLADLSADDVKVECCHGILNADNEFVHVNRETMRLIETHDNIHIYQGRLAITRGGHYGMSVRILPHHPALPIDFIPGYLKWFE